MVNAWSLAYDVINGTLDENFPPMTDNTITSLESDEYDPKPKSDKEDSDWKDPVITVGSGNTASMGDFINFDLTDQIDTITICLLYTSPSPRDGLLSRMPSSA